MADEVAIADDPTKASAQRSPAAPGADDECDDILSQMPPSKKTKLPRSSRHIVESGHLCCMLASYHKHFASYSSGRERVTQLIPNAVWKSIYAHFLEQYPNSTFQEESLKDRLRDKLKALKTGTSNEDGNDKAILQPNDLPVQLKASDGHASGYGLRVRKSVVDHSSLDLASSDDTTTVVEGQITSTPTKAGSNTSQEKEKIMSLTEILAEQARGIASMASTYEGHCEELMAAKVDSEKRRGRMYSQKERSLKINDLFKLRDGGVYSDEEFRAEIKKIMES